MIGNPLHQFEIHDLLNINVLGFDLVLTNAAVAMIVSVCLSCLMLVPVLTAQRGKISRATVFSEMVYDMVVKMVAGAAGSRAQKFVPLIFTLFLFILTCNLVGMVPGSFTATSHIAVTFAMAFFIFIFVTVLGFVKHGTHYLSLFLPKGVPLFMAPLLVVIELFAYLARPVSLSIRLAANMTAGHIVLKVLASFVVMSGVLGIFPLALLTILNGFEIFVAVLQAYIFSILTCVYLGDALNLH